MILPRASSFTRARNCTVVFVTAAISLIAASCRAADAKDSSAPKVFMWKATKDTGAVIYLVGSMHLAMPNLYPLPQPMEEAFDNADTLVVEADITKIDRDAMRKKMDEIGTYPKGDLLSRHLSSDGSALLKTFCKENGLSMLAFERMKPWVASMTLKMILAQKAGLNPSSGIDQHFLTAAAEKHKRVVELESPEFQFNLLAGLADASMELDLQHTLIDAPRMRDMVKELTDAWRAGDAAAVDRITHTLDTDDDPALQDMEKALNDDRNGPMAEKIAANAGSDHELFIVVGAAHLVGDQGVLHRLEAKGFHVTQVSK
jgi:uncharacterized protein YbaP (TraB family)